MENWRHCNSLITIQLFRPEKNKSETDGINALETKYIVPADVREILKASCYDCHSNNTVYPWYAEVQPVAWWLNNHVKEGKSALNFSEFTAYKIGRQYRKPADINELVKENEMPLKSYVFIHRYAKLNNQQKNSLLKWANTLRESIKGHYPEDSLRKMRH